MEDWGRTLLNSRNRRVPLVLLISGLLLACGGGGGGGGSSSTEVTGYVGDGPIENAAINCYQVDTNGQKTVSINDSSANPNGVSTASDGSFTLLTALASGPVLCTSTNGTDTANNTLAPDLSVMIPNGVPAGKSVTANLTTLTTVATQKVQTGPTPVTPTVVNDALSIVADAYGLTGCDLLTLVPLVPPSPSTCPPPSNPSLAPVEKRYQQILDDLNGTVTNGPNFTDLVDALATDLAHDTVLDGLDNGATIPLYTSTLAQIIAQPPGLPGSTTYSLLDTVIGLQFTPASACSVNCVNMALNATKSSAGILAIDIVATGISAGKVFGAAFDVVIQDPNNVTQWNGTGTMTCTESPDYPGCLQGDFLEGMPPVDYTVGLQKGTNNILLVSAYEFFPAMGVTGSGTIITLKFRVSGSGMISALSFNNNALYDSTPLPINNVTWGDGNSSSPLGGTVTIVPIPNNPT